MAVTTTDLQAYIGGSPADAVLLGDCLLQARELVDKYVGESPVPETILDRSYINVGAELFHARNAKNGIANAQFALADGGMGGQAVRIGRDPMRAATPLLRPWVSPW